jgi:hypothetical protein
MPLDSCRMVERGEEERAENGFLYLVLYWNPPFKGIEKDWEASRATKKILIIIRVCSNHTVQNMMSS